VPSQTNPYADQQNHQHHQQAQIRTKKDLGANEQRLADLFANRDDGADTFGNIGNLRCGILFLCFLLVEVDLCVCGFLQVWANGSWPFGCSAEDGHEPPQPVRSATAVDEQRASVLRYLAGDLSILPIKRTPRLSCPLFLFDATYFLPTLLLQPFFFILPCLSLRYYIHLTAVPVTFAPYYTLHSLIGYSCIMRVYL
jgi:hypothetical protein